MKNLFFLHTQYNIILGTAVLLDKYEGCQNDLVVYAEFTVTAEYKKSLNTIFDHVYFIREKFKPLKLGLWAVEKELWNQWLLYKKSVSYDTCYDNVFISQDRPLETLVVNRCKRLNASAHFADIEEDCYYSTTPELNDPNYSMGWHNKRSWILRKLMYRSLYNSDDKKGNYIYGQSSYFQSIYALFPELIRSQLSHLKREKITKNCIVQACRLLYPNLAISLPDSSKYYLFFFDLLERYKNPNTIKTIVEQIVTKATDEGAVVLLKYHPRETQKLEFEQSGICEIPYSIPAECLLSELTGKNVTVFGNATTAVVVSAKFGFNTVSIAGIEGLNNKYMIDIFKQMGIEVPETSKEIK